MAQHILTDAEYNEYQLLKAGRVGLKRALSKGAQKVYNCYYNSDTILSYAEVGKKTKLCPASVFTHVKKLIERGLLYKGDDLKIYPTQKLDNTSIE